MELHIALSSLLLFILLNSVKSEDWTHHTVLDGAGKYHLYWKPPEDKKANSIITFKVEVRTKGYVGFGLSPNGGMAGSDIVTGWVKDGQTYFQDRHGIGNTLPPIDLSQDWELMEAHENESFTMLKFRRALDTCDEDDMVIDESTMRLIYAYSDEDPVSDEISYHFRNRGSKSVMLLQSKVKRNRNLDLSSLLHWDIRSPDFDISNYETMYWCKIFKTPSLSVKHHIVYVEPLIQEGHEPFLHHMLLYECVGATAEEYDNYTDDYRGHQCHHPNMPDVMRKCEGVSIAWAVGGEDLVLPEHVGLPLDPDPGTYFMLEIHYDNQNRQKGIIDNSGLRIYYTPNLRKYDGGCLMIGSTITPRVFIPPGQQSYVVAGHSNPDCLGPVFPESGIKVLGVLLHSHLLGRKIKARHFRGNQELIPLAEEKNYDFNYQEYRYYEEEVDVLPVDQITVECTYNSSERRKVTFGGVSTTEEMCLAFVLYYPRVNRYASLSVPTFPNINNVINASASSPSDIYRDLSRYNWANANIDELENIMRNSKHDTHCYLGDGEKNTIKSLISYPSDLKPFVVESICNCSLCLWNLPNLYILICTVCLLLNLQNKLP